MDSYYIQNGAKVNSTNYLSSGGKLLFPNTNHYISFLRLFENVCEKHSPDTIKSLTEDFEKKEITIKKCCANFEENVFNHNNIKINYEL